MADPIQGYYDKEYHSEYTKSALLKDYSLRSRLHFFRPIVSQKTQGFSIMVAGQSNTNGLKDINKNGSYGVDVSESAIEFAKSKFADYKWKRFQ